MIRITGENWRRMAKCATIPRTNNFFPVGRQSPKIALQACSTCAVRAKCLQYALENEIEHGIWGGKTESQRRRMKKRK